MLPGRDELVEAYDAYAVRQGLHQEALKLSSAFQLPLSARPDAIDAALVLATELVATGIDETSAVLYSFARFPRCFPLARFGFVAVIARATAQSCNLLLVASTEAFRTVIAASTENRVSIDEVVAWVAGHTVPLRR